MRKVAGQSEKKKRLDPDHPDFDSEEEYGGEQDNDESGSELDDGSSIDLDAQELDDEEGEHDQEDQWVEDIAPDAAP